MFAQAWCDIIARWAGGDAPTGNRERSAPLHSGSGKDVSSRNPAGCREHRRHGAKHIDSDGEICRCGAGCQKQPRHDCAKHSMCNNSHKALADPFNLSIKQSVKPKVAIQALEQWRTSRDASAAGTASCNSFGMKTFSGCCLELSRTWCVEIRLALSGLRRFP